MRLQLQGTRLIINLVLVLGALYVPIVVGFAVQSKEGVGAVPFYWAFGLWFLATAGLAGVAKHPPAARELCGRTIFAMRHSPPGVSGVSSFPGLLLNRYGESSREIIVSARR